MKPILILTFLAIAIMWQCSTIKHTNLNTLHNGKWEELTTVDGSEPIKRHEAAFVKVGDKFYLVGGRRMNPVSIYHTKSNKWTTGAAPPIELHHFQPVVYGKDIYVLGALTGRYPGETPVPNIYIYETENNLWKKGPSIPVDRLRGGAGAVLMDDKIYMSCGIKDGHRGDHKKWLDAYNIKSGEWEILPDAPRPRDHFQSIIADNKLYNIAGRTTIADDNPFKNTIGEVDVYDFSTQEWSTIEEPIPTQRAGNFALLLGDEILVFGGESFVQKPAHQEVEALHINTHTWSNLPPLPQGRHGTGAVLFNNKIYTASGCGNQGGSPELSDLWAFTY
ncbi:MAG: galactose oxidase [Saprospiraceae bacterium]|nr:galactose oxidase [Saprospiraceae bacterium]